MFTELFKRCRIALLLCLFSQAAQAQMSTPYLMGPLGLNTVPNARMDKAGTVRATISTLDPYLNTSLGFQLADPLYISLRQTAEISNLNEEADRLYPGVDLKLRLNKETPTLPEVALGLQSAVGHKRMAGEYLALSKRYNDFDFTGGVGWGRLGSAGHFANPLKTFFSHFGKDRDLDGEMPNEPSDWFTGDKIGLFGGVEYYTPWEGLSLKLDYGSDRFKAEENAFNYDPPSPWSAGLTYAPVDWANFSIGMQGTEKIMARLSLSSNIRNWRDRMHGRTSEPAYMRPFRNGLALPSRMELAAGQDNQILYDAKNEARNASAKLMLEEGLPAPFQIGRAAVHMANHAGPYIEEVSVTPTIMGLRGPSVNLMRRDLEQSRVHNTGSPQEIWRHATFTRDKNATWRKLNRPAETRIGPMNYHFTLDNRVSLAEEDSGVLYRSSFLAGARGVRLFGLFDAGLTARLNLKDNLEKLNTYRFVSPLPVRSNVDEFAEKRLSIDNFYEAFSHSFNSDLHLMLTGGYLEEMYAGVGGELLYRPFDKRYAVGIEIWEALKRDPNTFLNLGLNGDHLLTGHVNAWYDFPEQDITLYAKAGRYLAEDIGATLGLAKTFDNGAKLEGFVTVTNNADFDVFGGTTHAYQGIRLSIPLGGFKHMPQNSDVKFRAEPFGRDTGQTLESPLPLYEVTEPFSQPHMIENWNTVTE